MFFYYLLQCVFMCFLFISGCKKEAIVDSQKIDPNDPKNYTWTVDTIFFSLSNNTSGQTLINAIWGANDTTVYAVGHDAWGGIGGMWFFNGKKWERKKIFKFEGGNIEQAISFNTVWGLDSGNIYFGGSHYYTNVNPPPNYLDTAVVLHYSNSVLKEIKIITEKPFGNAIYHISGLNPLNIYFSGQSNMLFHYDGQNVTPDTVPSFFKNQSLDFYIGYSIINNSSDIFLSCSLYDTLFRSHHQFVRKRNNGWELIDSFSVYSFFQDSQWGTDKVWKSNNGIIFSCGRGGIFKLNGTTWQNVFSSETIIDIFGTSETHLFGVSTTNKVYYCNGSSWEEIFEYQNSNAGSGSIWCSNNQVFVSFTYGDKSLIFRGKSLE